MAQRERSLVQMVQSWFSARSLWTGGGAALATAVVAPMVPDTSGWLRVGAVVLVGSPALVGFAVPAARAAEADRRTQVAEDALIDAQVKHRLTLSDALLPVLSSTINGVDPDGSTARNVAAAEALSMVLCMLVQLCGRGGEQRIRACWYQARGLDSDNPSLYPAAEAPSHPPSSAGPSLADEPSFVF